MGYTGLWYQKLCGPTGIPWPVNEQTPEGTDRLYTEPIFPTSTEQCETYGHDLLTGASLTEQEHRAMAPAGRAFLERVRLHPGARGPVLPEPERRPQGSERCDDLDISAEHGHRCGE